MWDSCQDGARFCPPPLNLVCWCSAVIPYFKDRNLGSITIHIFYTVKKTETTNKSFQIEKQRNISTYLNAKQIDISTYLLFAKLFYSQIPVHLIKADGLHISYHINSTKTLKGNLHFKTFLQALKVRYEINMEIVLMN